METCRRQDVGEHTIHKLYFFSMYTNTKVERNEGNCRISTSHSLIWPTIPNVSKFESTIKTVKIRRFDQIQMENIAGILCNKVIYTTRRDTQTYKLVATTLQ